jgi:hypothetical protein
MDAVLQQHETDHRVFALTFSIGRFVEQLSKCFDENPSPDTKVTKNLFSHGP